MSAPLASAPQESAPQRSKLATAMRAAVTMELAGWRNLFLWITRRPNIPAGSTGFGYSAPVTTILFVFIGLSAVEIPILDLILHRWPAARIASLVLGIWGLTFMLGLLAGFRVNPHTVGESGLRVRSGATLDLPLSWDDIDTITGGRRGLPESKTIQLTQNEGGAALHVVMQSETNVNVVLRRPVRVSLPKGDEVVTEVHFYADDAPALIAAAREHLESADSRRG